MTLYEKKEFVMLDHWRVLCAFFVAAIHLSPFRDVSPLVDFLICNIIARVAVPFFFLISGFFLQSKIDSKEATLKYLKHIGGLYLVYTLMYLPLKITVYGYIENGKPLIYNVAMYFRDFLFLGSYTHLWYFSALILAVVLFFALLRVCKANDKVLFFLGLFLYLAGVMGNTYFELLVNYLPHGVRTLAELYFKLFYTTRNGVFMGLPFVIWGYLIAKKRMLICKRKYVLCFMISLISMLVEGLTLYYKSNVSSFDMLIMVAPTAVFMLLMIMFVEKNESLVEKAKYFRNISTLVFCFHILVMYCVEKVSTIVLDRPINSLVQYVFVMIFTILLSCLIIWCVNNTKAKWLKCIY